MRLELNRFPEVVSSTSIGLTRRPRKTPSYFGEKAAGRTTHASGPVGVRFRCYSGSDTWKDSNPTFATGRILFGVCWLLDEVESWVNEYPGYVNEVPPFHRTFH